jgi:hypothetical protein
MSFKDKIQQLKPWEKLGWSKQFYMKQRLWKAAGIKRDRFEQMLIALPDHIIQNMKLDTDAEKLIQAMFEENE